MPVTNENLAVLSSRYGINAMVNYFNANLGDMSDLTIQDFYNKEILDAIELASENYIFKAYAKPYYVPEGHENKKLKRYGSLTEHTTPLPEGIPPKSDKTAVESFTATFNTYGRYMEFTDRVSYMTIDPIIAMYSEKYGQLAARTMERLARNEMLHSTSVLIAPSADKTKTNTTVATLKIGDRLTLNDVRVQVARMKRMLVEPLNGNNFDFVVSPEVKFDLITDKLVRDYYGKDSGVSAYANNELPILFNINVKENMLDDYAYGYDLANPGEIKVNGAYVLRLYTKSSDGLTTKYINIPEKVENTYYRTVVEARLADGSYIPEKVTWDVAGFLASDNKPAKVEQRVATYTGEDEYGNPKYTYADSEVDFPTGSVTWKQLPIHKCLLVGKDSLIETGIEGHTTPKIYVKPLGSAGVLDPLEQRQSIGFKIDTIGYSLLKPEACVVCYTIPTMAEETNDIMYTYETGVANMKHHSFDIKGKAYTQLQTEEKYNMYGKVTEFDENGKPIEVDNARRLVPPVQSPYYTGLDEFGSTPVYDAANDKYTQSPVSNNTSSEQTPATPGAGDGNDD